MIKSCIDLGLKINDPITEFGSSGIHIAVKYSKLNSIEILLKFGADINKKDKFDGWTALHISVLNTDKETCKLILKKGGD